MRTCTTCKSELPLTEFYKSKYKGRKKKVVSSTCKQCSIKATNENAKLKEEYYRAWRKEYLKRPEVIARMKAYRQTPEAKEARKELYRFHMQDPEHSARRRANDRRSFKLRCQNPEYVAARNAKRRAAYKLRKQRERGESNEHICIGQQSS